MQKYRTINHAKIIKSNQINAKNSVNILNGEFSTIALYLTFIITKK